MSTASGAGWVPLFDGGTAAEILEVVDEIERSLGDPPQLAARAGMRAEDLRGRRWPRFHNGYGSLGSGCAGIALVGAYRARHDSDTVDPGVIDRALAFVDESIEVMANAPLGPSLLSGYTGIAWSIAHLGGLLLDLDEAVFDEVEGQLLAYLRGFRRFEDHCDLVDGLTGIALYGLSRGPHGRAPQIVDACVERLQQWSEPSAGGRAWLTPAALLPQWQRADAPRGCFNLGVAHGAPAIVAVLGYAASAPGRADALELLRQGRTFMSSTRRPSDDASGLRYPAWTSPSGGWAPGRVAWCYGDLGIATTFMATAEALADLELGRELRQEAVELATRLAARGVDAADTEQTGLCHGTAGIGHLFNRLYQSTGDPRLAQAARHWLMKTLELRRPGRGIGGYTAWPVDVPDERKWKRDSGLLEGAAGVALALLASISEVSPQWDQVLLCSEPGPSVG